VTNAIGSLTDSVKTITGARTILERRRMLRPNRWNGRPESREEGKNETHKVGIGRVGIERCAMSRIKRVKSVVNMAPNLTLAGEKKIVPSEARCAMPPRPKLMAMIHLDQESSKNPQKKAKPVLKMMRRANGVDEEGDATLHPEYPLPLPCLVTARFLRSILLTSSLMKLGGSPRMHRGTLGRIRQTTWMKMPLIATTLIFQPPKKKRIRASERLENVDEDAHEDGAILRIRTRRPQQPIAILTVELKRLAKTSKTKMTSLTMIKLIENQGNIDSPQVQLEPRIAMWRATPTAKLRRRARSFRLGKKQFQFWSNQISRTTRDRPDKIDRVVIEDVEDAKSDGQHRVGSGFLNFSAPLCLSGNESTWLCDLH
jgi:hypothetical protein